MSSAFESDTSLIGSKKRPAGAGVTNGYLIRRLAVAPTVSWGLVPGWVGPFFHRKPMGKPWENPWENHGKTMGNHGKMGKPWENPRENHGKTGFRCAPKKTKSSDHNHWYRYGVTAGSKMTWPCVTMMCQCWRTTMRPLALETLFFSGGKGEEHGVALGWTIACSSPTLP